MRAAQVFNARNDALRTIALIQLARDTWNYAHVLIPWMKASFPSMFAEPPTCECGTVQGTKDPASTAFFTPAEECSAPIPTTAVAAKGALLP